MLPVSVDVVMQMEKADPKMRWKMLAFPTVDP